jgi:hypothetical protein
VNVRPIKAIGRSKSACHSNSRATFCFAKEISTIEALLMYAHGLSRRTLAGLVRAGLAAMRREVAVAGDRPVEVVRIRIAAAGRKAIEE